MLAKSLSTRIIVCDEEIDYEVDKIIKELEEIRKKAKAKIKKSNERIRNSI